MRIRFELLSETARGMTMFFRRAVIQSVGERQMPRVQYQPPMKGSDSSLMNSTKGAVTPSTRAAATMGRGSSPSPISRLPSNTTHLPTCSCQCCLSHSRVALKSGLKCARCIFGIETVDMVQLPCPVAYNLRDLTARALLFSRYDVKP